MKKNLSREVFISILMVSLAAAYSGAFSQGIRPWPDNLRYWEFRGKPVLLLGGSADDDLFQYAGFEEQLDTLVSCGGNVIRNTMSSQDSTRPWPFARVNGSYDLDRFNSEYWERFSRLLAEAHRRDVVVQVEVWATFSYYREAWTLFNPFNPSLNSNYTEARSGLPSVNQSHPTRADNPFFRTPPKYLNNKVVLPYQEKFVDKILSFTFQYDNVLYAMDNETSADPRWGEYWAGYIKKKAAQAGREVFVTEMWDPWELTHPWHLFTIDHPETYDFIDISQNNWQEGQKHQEALAYVRERIKDSPRPVNNTKVYAVRGGERWLNPRLAVDRFWGNVWGGCASTRFHRPTEAGSGIGINSTARRAIRGIRESLAGFEVFLSRVNDRLLKDRSENEAYCLEEEGRAWAVMFPEGGRVLLEPAGAPAGAAFEVRWFDADYLAWQPAYVVRSEPYIPLGAPGPGRWVARVEARQ